MCIYAIHVSFSFFLFLDSQLRWAVAYTGSLSLLMANKVYFFSAVSAHGVVNGDEEVHVHALQLEYQTY